MASDDPGKRGWRGEPVGQMFCSHWSHEIHHEVFRDDAPDTPLHRTLHDTYYALDLLEHWWFPVRESTDEQRRAEGRRWLTELIEEQVQVRAIRFREAFRTSITDGSTAERSRALQQSVEVLEGRATQKSIADAVALRLDTYDPRLLEVNPFELMWRYLDDALTVEVGRSDPAHPPKRTDLGQELKRRFALPADDPDRQRLQRALASIPSDQAEFLRVLYTKGTKEAERIAGSGRVRDAMRTKAIETLLVQLPELSVLRRSGRS
ncbi:MAG: hypothetical protein M3P18_21815 [Actinomycetota bacterium]|nr:hypothetical protein [Actinomycetota bacterium]